MSASRPNGRIAGPATSGPGRSGAGRGRVRPPRRSRTPIAVAVVAVLVVLGLFAIYRANTNPTAAASDRYDVGSPGVGATAPDFLLPDVTAPATAGGAPAITRLSNVRGKTVLLYFHEGLGCQPCWDQIRDLQNDPAALHAMGVDQLLTITSGPLALVAQKMHDDALTEPALVDSDLRVSAQYQANRYGMMGDSRDGHSFVLVGADGIIRWRADYGGPPRFTMYVPPQQLLADLRTARPRS